jgi:mRNA-degrading endonuclease RelE of RelBE toxin-antitoxin system
MNEDALNASVRKFLKKVGVTSQREIEKAVREAAERGTLQRNQKLPATMRLHVGGIELLLQIDGEIELD